MAMRQYDNETIKQGKVKREENSSQRAIRTYDDTQNAGYLQEADYNTDYANLSSQGSPLLTGIDSRCATDGNRLLSLCREIFMA